MPAYLDVSIRDIKFPESNRECGDVSDLAESLRLIGLLSPILLTKDFRLIAGYRRIMAAKRLGWINIPPI